MDLSGAERSVKSVVKKRSVDKMHEARGNFQCLRCKGAKGAKEEKILAGASTDGHWLFSGCASAASFHSWSIFLNLYEPLPCVRPDKAQKTALFPSGGNWSTLVVPNPL